MSGSDASAGAQTRSTGVVSLAILLSRVLGLVRDQLLGGWFGTKYAGIFTAAFRTPNMLRDLFAEGALSAAFVTTFSQTLKTDGEAAAWELGRKMVSLMLCFMTFVAAAGVALAPLLVRILNPGWKNEESYRLCILLAQIMYPFILVLSLAALVMGMLNARRVFFIPAVASAFFNIGCIAGGAGLAWLMDPGFRAGGLSGGGLGEQGLVAFAIGTLIGGLLQLLVQLPALHRAGFRFRPDWVWRHDRVRGVLRLMWPSMLAASGTQVNVLLNSIFASFTPGKESAAAWLAYAQRLQQLPLGLFGVAVATVTLPMLAQLAAGGITQGFRGALAKGLRLVLFLTLPCAVGLALLSRETVSLVFQYGKFNEHDVAMTAGALQAYAFGLVFYACVKVLQPAFLTIDKRFVPLVVTCCMIALNITVNSISVFVLGLDHRALAWCTAGLLAFDFAALYVWMGRLAGGLATRELVSALWRLGIALLVLAGICLAARSTVLAGWADMRLWLRVLALGGTVAIAAAAYFLATAKLGIEETREFLSLLGRRFGAGKR
ncbi:MAG: murein biosynthesis integral membrane protein MurJ [Akkermansiaceae bacterium]|nr:murein biosynthesis integral membrane protein MurJ [Akkermansiaceae bacterium]